MRVILVFVFVILVFFNFLHADPEIMMLDKSEDSEQINEIK